MYDFVSKKFDAQTFSDRVDVQKTILGIVLPKRETMFDRIGFSVQEQKNLPSVWWKVSLPSVGRIGEAGQRICVVRLDSNDHALVELHLYPRISPVPSAIRTGCAFQHFR